MAKQQVYRDPSRQSPEPQEPEPSETPGEDMPPADSVEEDASRSTADFVQNVRPLQEHKQKARKRRTILISAMLLLVLGGGGYAAYAYLQRDSKKEQSAEQTSQSKKESRPKSNALERYSSKDLNLSLEHPGNWQVDDSEQDELALTSPVTKLTDDAGQEVEAKVVLKVIPTSADGDFPKDQATAVRESIKFTYDSPAEGQRQETYLSFMNLDGPSDGLNAVYITGDKSYVKGDPVTKADFDAVEPIVWLEFAACPAGTCSGTEKLTITSGAWGSNEMLKNAFLILKSLSIK